MASTTSSTAEGGPDDDELATRIMMRDHVDLANDQVLDIHNFAASDAEDTVDGTDDHDASGFLAVGSHGTSAHVNSRRGSSMHHRKVCLDDFTLLRVIGRGAYGKVFLVRRKQPGEASLVSAATMSLSSLSLEPADPPAIQVTDAQGGSTAAMSESIPIAGASARQATTQTLGSHHYGSVRSVSSASGAPVDTNLYAMKVLRKASIVLHGKETEHTQNERSILEAIRHPFIVKLNYAFQTPQKLYLILSYASGGELFTYLAKERMFSEDVACFYISELLLAISHLHSLGIIYRDLKPENVLLDAEGHVILTDFGLSKVAVGAITVCGTIEFMAPEVLNEKLTYGKAVDYWSLGVMLYDMLTGSPPFTGNNRKKIMEAILNKKPAFPKYITPNSRDLCTKLLRKNPEQRLGNGDDGAETVKKHAFFRKIVWKSLLARQVTPPYIPKLVSIARDTSNFHSEFTSMGLAESPPNVASDGPDGGLRQSQNNKFLGFSFVADSFSLPH
ncbi:kinase-like domain-containing protein [Entophlyctis helioformis]|nr:kinase-like domain-containing protein [Entophlyctis helioformis]